MQGLHTYPQGPRIEKIMFTESQTTDFEVFTLIFIPHNYTYVRTHMNASKRAHVEVKSYCQT